MIWMLLIYFFVFGLIVGSFLNVVILRFNTGKTVGGRSGCMSCRTQLSWKELVPVFSFMFQRGRCKTCKVKLSWQYPFVELSTGILFVLNLIHWINVSRSIVECAILVGITTALISVMVVIFVYDMRHKIIPDLLSFTAWGLSIIYVCTLGFFVREPISFLVYFATGLFFYFVVWIIWKLSKGRMIGLGDAKLLLSIGTMLGFVYGISAIFISVWIATIYALFLLLKHYLSKKGKHITMKTEIPFGPFLIIGFLIVYFTQFDVTGLSVLLENFS